MNEPLKLLATYREKQFGFSREFFLYDDRILVRKRDLTGDVVELPIRLKTLAPDVGVHRRRSNAFKGALTSGLILGSVTALAAYSNRDEALPTTIVVCIFAAVSLISFVVATLTWKPVEFYFFQGAQRHGVRLLDIARRGPDVMHFEEFVGKIRSQIRVPWPPKSPSAKSKTAPGA